MRVKVGGVWHDSNVEPIAIDWTNTEHMLRTAKQLTNMPEREGRRVFIEYPTDSMTPEQVWDYCEVPAGAERTKLGEVKDGVHIDPSVK